MRLKVLLSLLWVSVRPPHETKYPARGWAALLDLDEPDTNGARRVNAALTWLGKEQYLRVIPQPGAPSIIFIMDERGAGMPYELPAEVVKARKEAGKGIPRDDYWVSLPAAFWLNGWIAVLSGSAVAMLLVLLDEAGGTGRNKGLWHSPRQAHDRFALSQDTRTNGLLELEAYRIVDKRRSSVSPGVFDFRRVRNVYDLHLEQLNVAPGEPRPRETVIPARSDRLGVGELEKLLDDLTSVESRPETSVSPDEHVPAPVLEAG